MFQAAPSLTSNPFSMRSQLALKGAAVNSGERLFQILNAEARLRQRQPEGRLLAAGKRMPWLAHPDVFASRLAFSKYRYI
jgi:hypothetical protein